MASAGGAEAPDASIEIVEGAPKMNGDPTYQAQIYVPRDRGVHVLTAGQKPPTVCIRGPSRLDRSDAESDGEKLLKTFRKSGIAEVRKLRSILSDEACLGRFGGDRK